MRYTCNYMLKRSVIDRIFVLSFLFFSLLHVPFYFLILSLLHQPLTEKEKNYTLFVSYSWHSWAEGKSVTMNSFLFVKIERGDENEVEVKKKAISNQNVLYRVNTKCHKWFKPNLIESKAITTQQRNWCYCYMYITSLKLYHWFTLSVICFV